MSLSLDHIALPIHDVPGTLWFYSELLGLRLIDAMSGGDWDGKPWLMMTFGLGDGRQLALCTRGDEPHLLAPESLDLPHFALSAADEEALKVWESLLDKANVPYQVERHGEQRSLYFRDPNGLVLEITAPPSQALHHDLRDARATIEDWLKASAE